MLDAFFSQPQLRLLPVQNIGCSAYVPFTKHRVWSLLMSNSFAVWKVALAVVVLTGLAVSQSSHKLRAIEINGHNGEATVYYIDGKSFIELESLVRIGNGFISFRNDYIVLTLPPASDSANHQEAGKSDAGMSSEFMKTAVQDV